MKTRDVTFSRGPASSLCSYGFRPRTFHPVVLPAAAELPEGRPGAQHIVGLQKRVSWIELAIMESWWYTSGCNLFKVNISWWYIVPKWQIRKCFWLYRGIVFLRLHHRIPLNSNLSDLPVLYVYVWLIHFVIKQKLTHHCKAVVLQ